jgi:hypothetical protein
MNSCSFDKLRTSPERDGLRHFSGMTSQKHQQFLIVIDIKYALLIVISIERMPNG